MATLKEHQAAMVDLLANGSGIPASASRLAHAMHDVLGFLDNATMYRKALDVRTHLHPCDMTTDRLVDAADCNCPDATTPGLNDKALSKREKALKTDSPAKWPTPAEQRVKELENTIKQLKANNAKLKHELSQIRAVFTSPEAELKFLAQQEQAGCRKYDTQHCEHHNVERIGSELICCDCGAKR